MDSAKDPAFKLFGRKIQVTDVQIQAKLQPKNAETDVCKEDNSELSAEEGREAKQEYQMPMQMNQEAQGTFGSKEEQAETDGADQEKVPKKPDKILPCPRCNSLETKFCYFNNYNVNQPRHFCKNCQRYWTAGGTMRNVPIGAGRRKNKHLASQYRQILVSSDGVPITGIESSESSSHQFLSSVESANNLRPSTTGNGVVLKFGPEAPLCESMETVLNLGEQKRYAEMSSANCQDNGEEPSSCGSSMTTSSCQGNGLRETVSPKEQGGMSGSTVEPNASHPLPCYPVPPWVVPWNPNWRNAPSIITSQQPSGPACSANSNNANQVQWYPTPILAVPSFCPPSIPLQLVPASYLSCMPVWPAPGAGNILANGSNGCSSPSSSASTSCCSGNGSPKLGKHSRDASRTGEEQPESCVLVPKTLRIDDPNEALRSPLWSTLGLKLDQKTPVSRRGTVVKTLETSKAEGIGHVPESTQILEANPAALSRSTTFQESS